MSERLSERELDVIIEAAHPSRPDREQLVRTHVEAILASRLAAVEALADEWEAEGLCDRADGLRAQLAPTPDHPDTAHERQR
jgi:lipopolysaccharide biosynthesis regulator YciM